MDMDRSHYLSGMSSGPGLFCLCAHRIRELDSAHGLEDSRVIKTARSLYRCFLSCKDAFPSPEMKEQIAKGVWDEARVRERAHPDLPRQEEKAGLLFCQIWQ